MCIAALVPPAPWPHTRSRRDSSMDKDWNKTVVLLAAAALLGLAACDDGGQTGTDPGPQCTHESRTVGLDEKVNGYSASEVMDRVGGARSTELRWSGATTTLELGLTHGGGD